MANQTHPAPAHPAHAPAAHAAAEHKAKAKADPASAQYVVNLTPEQYEAATKADAPPPPQMEVGGSGTAKAAFTDAAGGAVTIASSVWTSTGPVTVTPDEKDPTSAKLEAKGPDIGPATITVTGTTADGSAQASTSMTVIEKVGKPVGGTIDITVQPPAAPAPGPAAAPAAHAPAKA